MNNKKFSGVIPALMTPFDVNQHIDLVAIESLIEDLINKGVHGLYVTGSTGEGLSMSIDERNCVVEKVCKFANNRIPVIAHTGAISTQQAVLLSKFAEQAGADAISAIPPFYYKFSQEEIVAHYRKIAESVSIPLFVYNIPATTGVNLSIEILESLLEIENIIGLKYTSLDIFTLERIKQLKSDPIVFSGSDEMSFYGLWAGADGLVGSSYNLLGDINVKMYEAFLEKKFELAHTHYKLASELLSELLQYPYFSAVRKVMEWTGVNIGMPRSPFQEISVEQSETLRAQLRNILHKYPNIHTTIKSFII